MRKWLHLSLLLGCVYAVFTPEPSRAEHSFSLFLPSVVSLQFPFETVQICGLDIYSAGVHIATLVNRVKVAYTSTEAKAPALVRWIDMQGTKIHLLAGAEWISLSQTSSPGVGVFFSEYGQVQASGTLKRCLPPVGCRSDYFYTRIEITETGTFCNQERQAWKAPYIGEVWSSGFSR